MDAKRDQDPPEAQRDPGPVAPAIEHFGPLQIRRLAKDDGRALIVYERRDRAPA